MFSDETQLYQMKTDCIPKWVSQEEAYRLEYVDQHDRNARINVMFCGYLTYSEVGSQVLIYRNINSEKYIETLDKIIWAVIAKHSPFIYLE